MKGSAFVASTGLCTLLAWAPGCFRAPGPDPVEDAGATRVVVTLATGGVEPNGIAVQGSDVYWAAVDWNSDAGASGYGSLRRVSTSGGPVTVLGAGIIPSTVIADDANIYWSAAYGLVDGGNTASDGVLLRTPRASGPTSVVATTMEVPLASAIALGGGTLYWIASTSDASGSASNVVMALPSNGGAPAVVATAPANQQIGSIAADASALYWVVSTSSLGDDAAVLKASPGGSPEQLTWTTKGAAIAVGPTAIVVLDVVDGGAEVRSIPLNGGAGITLAPQLSAAWPLSVAVDADSAYWSVGTDVWKSSLTLAAPIQIASLPQGSMVTGLALDETSAYLVYQLYQAPCTDPLGCAVVAKVTPK